MGLFAKRAKESHSSIQFLHSQDGPMERTITEKLAEFFRDVPQVEEAYFARVLYGGRTREWRFASLADRNWIRCRC